MYFSNHIKTFSLFVLLLISLTVKSQKIQYDQDVSRYYNEGIAHFNNGDYHAANAAFRNALATNRVLPTNLSYYFAETLYYIRQFQNSRNFVEKYINLAGYSGDFYEEAIHLRELINNEFQKIIDCQRCNSFGYRLIFCERCETTGVEMTECPDCKGTGNTLCPKCTGKGVLITLDTFSQNHYETCDKCQGEGVIVCELCEGHKEITRICTLCLGVGLRSSNVICTHEDLEEEEEDDDDDDEQKELFQKKKVYRQ